MKYTDFKRYKLSKILKVINFKRYNLSRVYDFIDFKRCALLLSTFYKSLLSTIYKFLNFRRYDFSKIIRYVDFDIKINFSHKIYKLIKLKNYKQILLYTVSFLIFSSLVYLNIPLFYSYDKSEIENIICKDFSIKCSIKGDIKYSFFPSPRFKINDFIIKDFTDENKVLGKIETLEARVPIDSIHKKNFIYYRVDLINYEMNFDLQKIKLYNNFFDGKIITKPFNFKNGQINFYDNTKYVSTIRSAKLKYKSSKKLDEVILKGLFLNDRIYINLQNKKNKSKPLKTLTVKLLKSKFSAKVNMLNLNKEVMSGDFIFKKNKNNLSAFYDYKSDKITIKKANLKNEFLDGKFTGEVVFNPHFNFNLDINLSGVNFNKFYNFIVSLDEKKKKNLFKINKKINGLLNLSTDKIYSKFDLVDSFETQLKFINGSILIERLLLNLGKLGATDITGIIKNNEKFSILKFENNIFIDNKKYFYRKFGIFNKKDISSGLYISGNLDLINLKVLIDEISTDKKIPEEDIVFFQKEFNALLLEGGYANLLNFLKLKEFVKIVLAERN